MLYSKFPWTLFAAKSMYLLFIVSLRMSYYTLCMEYVAIKRKEHILLQESCDKTIDFNGVTHPYLCVITGPIVQRCIISGCVVIRIQCYSAGVVKNWCFVALWMKLLPRGIKFCWCPCCYGENTNAIVKLLVPCIIVGTFVNDYKCSNLIYILSYSGY